MATVLDTFRGQSLDFFGALRSATYDNQIRSWIKEIVKGDINADGAAMQELSRRLINRSLSGIPPWFLTSPDHPCCIPNRALSLPTYLGSQMDCSHRP